MKKKNFPPYDNIDFNDDVFLKNKNETIPGSLFKYTKIKYAKDILLDDLMFLPKIYELNDPYEGELLYDLDKLKENYANIHFQDFFDEFSSKFKDINRRDIKEVCCSILKNYHAPQSLDELSKYIKSNISVICLSKTNNINSLWAHYAENHRGICIEYDIKNCNYDLIRDLCFEVDYVELSDNTEDIKEYFEEDHLDLNVMLLPLLKKSEDWSYEKEWRIILHDYSLSNFHNNFYSDKHYMRFIKPKAVYMGLKIKEENEELIKEICKMRKIPLFKAKKDNNNYKLGFDEIEFEEN